ncbi:unnamed protein product, partial [Hymenolepis diminuta]
MISTELSVLFVSLERFFEEPWAMALFHDRFYEFKEDIHELCCKAKEKDQGTLIDFVRSTIDPSEK